MAEIKLTFVEVYANNWAANNIKMLSDMGITTVIVNLIQNCM